MKRCRGQLWGEMWNGLIRISREDAQGRKVYRYQCQRCGEITESPNGNRKLCWYPEPSRGL